LDWWAFATEYGLTTEAFGKSTFPMLKALYARHVGKFRLGCYFAGLQMYAQIGGNGFDPMDVVPPLPGEVDDEHEQVKKELFQFVAGFGLKFPPDLREQVHNVCVGKGYSDEEAEEIITEVFPYWGRK